MGMPITIEIVDASAKKSDIDMIFDYFRSIDQKFSVYKNDSEITKINKGQIKPKEYSQDMKTVFKLCQQTKKETNGYFDIKHMGKIDPSGLVKGWAINNAALMLKKDFANFYIEAGGDIQSCGHNSQGKPWSVGIRNPFNIQQIVKIVTLSGNAIATSGTYFRGQHVYNPKKPDRPLTQVVSLSVIGPNIYEADRFATAAFAMGLDGIKFIETLEGFEGYQIDNQGQALFTSQFTKFTLPQC